MHISKSVLSEENSNSALQVRCNGKLEKKTHTYKIYVLV